MAELEAQYLPAGDVLAIARDLVRARAAATRGEFTEAETLLRTAIALEGGIGYMEPPYWYYPVHQTLGSVLLQAGRLLEAAAAFETALAQTPNNGWALWGLMKAREAEFGPNPDQADEAELRQLRSRVEAVWLGDAQILSLDRL